MPGPSPFHARSPRARRARARTASTAALLLVAALAACGERTDEAADPPAADAPPADTSALAVARRQLGPEVRQAIPFRVLQYTARFIAAAVPVAEVMEDPLRPGVQVAPGSHEIVLLEMPDTSATHAFSKPGLYVSPPPGVPEDDALRLLTGVDDMDGNGDPEVWSVRHGGPDAPYAWEIRAYDRGGRALFQLAAPRGPDGAGLDPASLEPSATLENEPQIRAWLTEKLRTLETHFGGTAANGGR